VVDQANVKMQPGDPSLPSGRAWRFDADNWPAAKTLYVTVHAVDHAGDLSFAVIDWNHMRPIRCVDTDLFRTISIDTRVHVINADGKTFSFEDCNLDPMSPAITVFPMPIAHGKLETGIQYRLDARVE
jgi:hypothetical protein